MSDFESSVEAVSSFAAPVREGLPPSYRMRAEGHYVDLLASRPSGPREKTLALHALHSDSSEPAAPALVESIRRYGVIQPLLVQEQDDEFRVIAGHKRLAAAREAGLREVPCVVYEIADEKAARLGEASNVSGRPAVDAIAVAAQPEPQTADRSLHAGAELTQSLTTIAACADLLSAAPSDLTRGVVGNLIRAESWRASTLLVATRILRGELTVARTPVDVNTLLARVAQGFAAERAVRHSAVEVRSALAPHTCIACDDQVLSGALAAAVMATLSLFEGTREATIALTATAEAGQPTVITVSQRCASAHAAWSARAFDRTWSDRPGGATALLLMLSMQQAAETLGATLSVDSGAAGTSIALTFPASW